MSSTMTELFIGTECMVHLLILGFNKSKYKDSKVDPKGLLPALETLVPYKRKPGGRISSTRLLTYEDITRVYTFIHNFGQEFAIPLPDRVHRFKRGD